MTVAVVEASNLYNRVALRIVPIVIVGYIVAFIDRVNVGFAKLQFVSDLHFNEAIYGFGAGLFYIGYFLFEVPSNLMLERFGARLTLTRIMTLWGAISASMAFVSTPTQFYALRFLLGAAEAGFFPGVILYLSYWFPAAERGRITALFAMGAPIAGIVGGPISGWLMSLDGMNGLRGWQILFIYEGLPSILLALAYFLLVDDSPRNATWLSDDDKASIARNLSTNKAPPKLSIRAKLAQVARIPRVYILALAYFSVQGGTQAVALWTPTLVRKFGVALTSTGALSALPFAAAVAAMYTLGRSSDRSMERRWHFFGAMLAAALSFACLSLASGSLAATLTLLMIAGGGAFASLSLFWTIPPTELPEEARAAGIAFISSSGALGGFLSPVVIGWGSEITGNLYGGLAAVGAMSALCGAVILAATGRTRLPT